MLLLSMETSSSQGSLLLASTDQKELSKSTKYDVLFEKTWHSQDQQHSQAIIPFLSEALKAVDPKSIDAFCLSHGPGSFTGVRVSVNVVRSLAYSLQKPIYPVDSLQTLMEKATKNYENIVALMPAQKNQFYCKMFSNKQFSETYVTTLSSLEKKIKTPCLCLGAVESDFSESLKSLLNKDLKFSNFPSAQGVLDILLSEKILPCSWDQLIPKYIKLSSAEEKLKNIQYD